MKRLTRRSMSSLGPLSARTSSVAALPISGLSSHAMARFFSALTLVCLLASTAPQIARTQGAAVQVTIIAMDETNRRVQGLQIELKPAPDVASSNMITDEVGGISVNLKPGTYQLTATRPGFHDLSTQIEVKAGSDQQNFTIRVHGHVVESVDTKVRALRVSVAHYHEDVSYTLADLKSMPHTTVAIHNPHSNADETYSGVRLADLLAPLGVPVGKDLRGEALALAIVAAGSDGYKVALSIAEIDPAFHPGEVIVADALNGKPLAPDLGPFRLVVTEDKRPARAVRNLVSIELKATN